MLALIRSLSHDDAILAERRYAELLLVLHCVLTAVVSWIALCMLWPDSNLFGQARTFRVFSEIAPQHYWGVGFTIAALCGLVGCIWHKHSNLAAVATAAVSAAHMTVGMTLAASLQITFGVVSYICWGFLGFYVLWNKLWRDR